MKLPSEEESEKARWEYISRVAGSNGKMYKDSWTACYHWIKDKMSSQSTHDENVMMKTGNEDMGDKDLTKKQIYELAKKECKAEHCQHAFYKGYRAALKKRDNSPEKSSKNVEGKDESHNQV